MLKWISPHVTEKTFSSHVIWPLNNLLITPVLLQENFAFKFSASWQNCLCLWQRVTVINSKIWLSERSQPLAVSGACVPAVCRGQTEWQSGEQEVPGEDTQRLLSHNRVEGSERWGKQWRWNNHLEHRFSTGGLTPPFRSWHTRNEATRRKYENLFYTHQVQHEYVIKCIYLFIFYLVIDVPVALKGSTFH